MGLRKAFAIGVMTVLGVAPSPATAQGDQGDVAAAMVMPAAGVAVATVSRQMRDPASVHFDVADMRVAVVERNIVVCGSVETRDQAGRDKKLRWVELVDARSAPYRVADGAVEGRAMEFPTIWNHICTAHAEPAAWVMARTGAMAPELVEP